MTKAGLLLGCIADDLTGATDIANTLARRGMTVVQVIGVPVEKTSIPPAEAVVVALKSRTIPASDAVTQSLAACRWQVKALALKYLIPDLRNPTAMPRFAANLSMTFNEVDFLGRFAAARQQGFTAVEYLFPYAWPKAELAARLEGEGLQQVLFNAPPGDWDAGERGIAGVPGQEDAFRRTIERALEYAIALKCPRIHVMSGIVPEGASRESHRATLIANLHEAAPLAKQAGVAVLLEALNPIDFPGYLVGSIETASAVIEEVGSDNIFLQYDLYHCQMMQGRLALTMGEKLGQIRHMQIAGVPGRNEPDAAQEINYPALFALMDELGYQEWVGCEYRPRGETIAGLGWAAPWNIGPGAGKGR